MYFIFMRLQLNGVINAKLGESERMKRLHFCILLRKLATAKHEASERATVCLSESRELRCIMAGREDFIYGSIRNKQKEIQEQYLGTVLNSERLFPR